jgi:hypothetical protein
MAGHYRVLCMFRWVANSHADDVAPCSAIRHRHRSCLRWLGTTRRAGDFLRAATRRSSVRQRPGRRHDAVQVCTCLKIVAFNKGRVCFGSYLSQSNTWHLNTVRRRRMEACGLQECTGMHEGQGYCEVLSRYGHRCLAQGPQKRLMPNDNRHETSCSAGGR